jgi:hypothetical protein
MAGYDPTPKSFEHERMTSLGDGRKPSAPRFPLAGRPETRKIYASSGVIRGILVE